MDKKAIMVFGVGELQKSIIGRAHKMGLFVVGIDPRSDAVCKGDCDAFEVVDGQDLIRTIALCHKYNVKAIVTVATDKPLVMMADVAEKLNFPFCSVRTAMWSTDKFQMKQRFMESGIPCAKGRLISNADEVECMEFPIIVKPRDNSGSRGVKLCRNEEELQDSISEALENSRLTTVLVEEFIEGREFSIESLHYDGKSEIIQFTEKKTTEFPYNVEPGHKQPANLTDDQRQQICNIIDMIAECMQFKNCPSHTELKVNDRGIFVIETSPRLGGDYITSTLTPLSTGINIEDQLLHIALGESVDTKTGRVEKASAVRFFYFPQGKIELISSEFDNVINWPNIVAFDFKLHVGDSINRVTSSLNRYGQFIVEADDRAEIDKLVEEYEMKLNNFITIN